ncbi:SusD/RagB family nutrient-binding outer membrane lipoprotein [Flavobacterium cellulosilyticum]|uniref:SusD/RagB family nutrient-binding outer membrane lipoprotein n=1 Tax=Flavobacterium cellulosilyticum TaxID=2541731 RepID=A0A4R5CAB7_9FLAO|nr:SusD/RagB family nutrient-binding outer membrane lipoprotein [Flavobacterium cellulosilyticum]TDD96265.1 SusD/RagB family nutrient-binding outer membrane lipoprotein [Flavobacterium cellulosilyticum]
MKKFIISILVLSTTFVGCSSDLDINRDPDSLSPSTVPLSAQLPAGITGIIGSEGAAMSIIGGMWSQYWTQSNAANQYKFIDNYSIGTSDYNFIWTGMYDGLGDIRNVKRRALAEENWNYYLIATILEVQASQILTDLYGSIPYKEANNPSILEPKFNTGEEVYTYMIEDLNDALSKSLAASKGTIPGSDDLIFAGNMSNWTKFANTLKLKIYLRQIYSARATIASDGIKQMIAAGTQFLSVDAGMTQFTDAINQSNPLYEYNNRRLNVATNMRMSATLASYFDNNGDTRKTKYYLAGNSLNQGDYDSTVGAGTIAIVNLSATTPALLMSKENSLFLQAEAMERFGTGGKSLYEAAVNANFTRYGLVGSTFVSGKYAYPTTGTLEQKVEAIITQKWIASFPGNGYEAFFEKNRTGYPKTSTVYSTSAAYIPGQFVYAKNGTTLGLFPKRIVYPLVERNANSNAPALVTLTTPVWWAKN